MEIHELNSKALTDPAYIAVDDGADTYKFDVKPRFDAYDALPDAIDALNAESKLHYFATASAANAFTKEVTLTSLSDIRVGDYIVILFENGNTAIIFSIKFNVTPVSDVFGVLNFYDLTDKPTIKEGMALMFHVSSIVYPAGETDIVMDYVGPAITSGGGGGTSDYTDLTNKPQINGVTLYGNKTSADLGIGVHEWSYLPHRTNPAVDAHNSYSMVNCMELGTTATLRHNLMLEALGGNTGDFVATWTESTGNKDYADSSGQTSVYAMMYKDTWANRNVKTDATIQTSEVVDVFPHNDTVYDENGDALCTIVAASDSTVKRRSNDYIFIGTVYGSDGKYHIVYRTATTSSTPAITLGNTINVLQINGAEWDMTTLRSDYTQKTSQLNTKIIYRTNYYYMAVVQNGVGIAIMKSSDCIDWDLEHHIPDPDAHLEACMCATAYISNNMPTVFVAVRHNYGDGFITLYGFKGLTTWTEMSKVYIPASTGRPMMVSDSNVNYAFLAFSVNGRRNAVIVRIGSNNDGTTSYNLLTTPFNVMSNYPCLTFNNKIILFGGTNGLGSSKNGVSIAPIWTEELTNYDTNMSNLLDVVEYGAFTPNYTSTDEGKFLTIDSNGDIVATALSAWTGGSY